MSAPSPHDILDQIQARLNEGTSPAQVIAELLPRTRAEAVGWGRRLPAWDEYRGQYPGQTVAVARLVSRQALRAFRLILTEYGQVIDKPGEQGRHRTPEPSLRFRLALGDEEVCVAYTPDYFPQDDRSDFYFTSLHESSQPHPLSGSGYWTHFASQDAVEACGGPQAYAAQLAAARLRGEEKSFDAAFEGKPPEYRKQPAGSKGRRRRKVPLPAMPAPTEPPPIAVLGEYTAQVIVEREAQPPQQPPRQRLLFE
jgi:hypothetical protein